MRRLSFGQDREAQLIVNDQPAVLSLIHAAWNRERGFILENTQMVTKGSEFCFSWIDLFCNRHTVFKINKEIYIQLYVLTDITMCLEMYFMYVKQNC